MSSEELIAHHLRAQTRLRGVVEAVEYTSESEGLGTGSIRCLELQQLVPFSCRNISLEKGVVRIAHPGDPCTMKLSCRGQEVRATSIRIKARRPPQPGAAGDGAALSSPMLHPGSDPVAVPAASGSQQQQLDPVGPSSQGRSPDANGSSGGGNAGGATEGNSGTHEIFKRDSPLNALEYQPPADGTHAGAVTGVSAPGSSYGLSPHPAGPPQWPGSLPWSAMEPVTPGQSLQHGAGVPGAMAPQHPASPMPSQLPASLQSSPPPPTGAASGGGAHPTVQ